MAGSRRHPSPPPPGPPAAHRSEGSGLLILDVSREVAGHLALALQGHRDWARVRRLALPKELDEIERALAIRARRGQVGTPLENPAEPLEAEPVSPRLVTYADTAALLHVGERTVKRLVAAGALRPLRIGGAARLRLTDIDAYIDRLAAESPTPKEAASC
jgi:excisionase family DNA binding protein